MTYALLLLVFMLILFIESTLYKITHYSFRIWLYKKKKLQNISVLIKLTFYLFKPHLRSSFLFFNRKYVCCMDDIIFHGRREFWIFECFIANQSSHDFFVCLLFFSSFYLDHSQKNSCQIWIDEIETHGMIVWMFCFHIYT